MKKNSFLILLAIVVLGALARLLPHAPNMTPIGAIAIFCGMMFPRWWGVLIPIAAMFVSDIFIGFYGWQQMLTEAYLPFMMMALLGKVSYGHDSPKNVFLSMLAGSVVFFLVSNFSVWIFAGSSYGRSLAGIIACYAAALPFFRNQFIGDFLYVFTFFGLWWMARARWLAKNMKTIKVKSKK